MAFLRFAREKVDVALIEVGLGGRLDATNVVSPALCIITSICFDHMEFLGNTLAEIAREKAGIIKPGVPVVIGHLPPEAEAAVRAVAMKLKVPVHSVREIFGDDLAQYPGARLEGSHQRINAATATLAVRILSSVEPLCPPNTGIPAAVSLVTGSAGVPPAAAGVSPAAFSSPTERLGGTPSPATGTVALPETNRSGTNFSSGDEFYAANPNLKPLWPISDSAITEALATVDWPARWQRFPLSENRQLILDASHNPEGAQTLDENLTRLRAETGRAPIILVGALGEHRARALLVVAAEHAREIVLLQPAQSRATPFEELEQFVPKTFSGPIHRGVVAEIFPAPGVCALGRPGDTMVATGSIYLLGEILEHFSHANLVGESVLQDSP
jgi:dihydrofolate synthase/folylpolyglutamate synthase